MLRSLFCFLSGLAIWTSAISPGSRIFAEEALKPKSSWITFLSMRSGNNILYRMRSDGSELSAVFGGTVKDAPGLAEGTTFYREPHWTWQSPDRQHFASCVYDLVLPREKHRFRSQFALHLGRTNGIGPTRIMAPVAVEAVAWSPNGKRLAYGVQTQLETGPFNPAKLSQIFVIAIDGSEEKLVLEHAGNWRPHDWSPDGKQLLLGWSEFSNLSLLRSELLELDMQRVEQASKNAEPYRQWWRSESSLNEVIGKAGPVDVIDGRYSPNGKFVAVIAIRKKVKPSEWDSLDFELGVIERATANYVKVAWYKEGMRGPICWSPDGTEILFSRPLKEGDFREGGKMELGALHQEWGLGIWAIKPDGTGERWITTGWSPDWR